MTLSTVRILGLPAEIQLKIFCSADPPTLVALCNTARWLSDLVLSPHRLLPHISCQTHPIFGPNAGGFFKLTQSERKMLLIKQSLLHKGRHSGTKFRKTKALLENSTKNVLKHDNGRLLCWVSEGKVYVWDDFSDACLLKRQLQIVLSNDGNRACYAYYGFYGYYAHHDDDDVDDTFMPMSSVHSTPTARNEVPGGWISGVAITDNGIDVLIWSCESSSVKIERLQFDSGAPTHRILTFDTFSERGQICKGWFRGSQLHILRLRNPRILVDTAAPSVIQRMEHWDLHGDFELPLRSVDFGAWCPYLYPWYLFVSPQSTFAGVQGALLFDASGPSGRTSQRSLVFRDASRPFDDSQYRLEEYHLHGILCPDTQWYVHLFNADSDRAIQWPCDQEHLFHMSSTDRQVLHYRRVGSRGDVLHIYDSIGASYYVCGRYQALRMKRSDPTKDELDRLADACVISSACE